MNTVKPNPWKGVVPYSDNAEDLAIHPFRGRDKEISELLKVIDRYNISTLYGRSGIGKTSLLNAGAFPRLREKGFYPVRIRLTDHEENFALAIRSRLKDIAVLQDETAWPLSIPRAEEENGYLWAYFAYHRFFVGEDEVIPVIVLDQFEEVLRKAKKKSSLLIKQLYDTLQDGLLANGTPYTIGFRFVISLREDDLYLLEELLDQNYIDTLKQGRYRLRPVGEEGIEEIVNIRPGVIADDRELPNIIHLLTEKTQQDEQVSTLLLSLVCSQLYEATNGAPITLQNVTDMLKNSKTDVLETFYDKATEQLDIKAKDYLIAHCVDEDGRRKPVLKTELEQHIGKNHADNLCDETKPHHIFTAVSGELLQRKNYVELLHDQLAIILLAKRAKQQAEQRLRRIRKWAIVLGIIATLIGLISLTVPRIMTATTPLDTRLAEIGDTLEDQGRHYRSVTNFVDLSKYKKIKETALVGLSGANRMRIRSSQLGDIRYCTFPEIDTLEVVMDSIVINTSKYYNPLTLNEIDSTKFPNLTVLKIESATSSKDFKTYYLYNYLPKLKSVETLDTTVFRSHRGTLYVCSDSISLAIVTSSKGHPVYEETYFSSRGYKDPENANAIVDYDIAAVPPRKLEDNAQNSNKYYRIVCSKPAKKTIDKSDIPREILPKVLEANLPNITTIGDSVFYKSSIRRIYAPNVTILGRAAFAFCTDLDSINLKKNTVLGNHVFDHCSSLSYANIGKPDTIPDGAFVNCNSLKEVVGTTSAKHIGDSAFESCNALTSIDIPNVKSIGKMGFKDCNSLTKITGEHVKYIRNESFMDCDMLQDVEFPKLEEIGFGAFISCPLLQHIKFPALEKVGSYVFLGCTQLQSINLPKVKHVDNIFPFNSCPSLQAIYLDNAKSFTGYFSRNLKILYAPLLDSLTISEVHPQAELKIWLPRLKYLEVLSLGHFDIFIPNDCIIDLKEPLSDTSLFIKQEPIDELQRMCEASKNKRITYPKVKKEQGYIVIGNIIIINDNNIPHLKIGSNIEDIVGLYRDLRINKISLSPLNTKYMIIGNGLYSTDTVDKGKDISYCTREYNKPIIFAKNSNNVTYTDSCTIIYYNNIYYQDISIYGYYEINNAKIFVPYGKAEWYKTQLRDRTGITVEEMGWLKTLYYRIAYSDFIIQIRVVCKLYRITLIWLIAVAAFVVLKRVILKKKLKWKDGLVVIGIPIVLLPLLSLAHLADVDANLLALTCSPIIIFAVIAIVRKCEPLRDFKDVLIVSACYIVGLIVVIITNMSLLGALFALLLWTAYLVITSIRRWRKLQRDSEETEKVDT